MLVAFDLLLLLLKTTHGCSSLLIALEIFSSVRRLLKLMLLVIMLMKSTSFHVYRKAELFDPLILGFCLLSHHVILIFDRYGLSLLELDHLNRPLLKLTLCHPQLLLMLPINNGKFHPYQLETLPDLLVQLLVVFLHALALIQQ